MAIVPNNQNLNPSLPGLFAAVQPAFKRAMDSLLSGGGSITLDLPPTRSVCPGGCRYNGTYKVYMGSTGELCQECKGAGFLYEQRQTTYACNRRWTNEPLDQNETGGKDTPAGRIYGNFVRTKTVIESFSHIQESLGATIDSSKVKLYREPRKTGLGDQLYYVIAWWERVNLTDG
jgi:hypothetical protein